MADSEAILRRWAATRTGLSADDITSVEFEHEDGYEAESGTYWPAETIAVVRTISRDETFTCESDVAVLLREILDVGS